jgi:hypothetical protein
MKNKKKHFQKGDLVRISASGSCWDGIIGIYKGATDAAGNDCEDWTGIGRIFLPWIHRSTKIKVSSLSEPENLIGYFYTRQLEKIE